ncbi:hypothetical protein [Sorangium sp. So ce204]|uniref:hypothetical protein n=1 Tax=Sorangium sp. So ce204 TaxID=3133288 RepID=UPI003F5F497C
MARSVSRAHRRTRLAPRACSEAERRLGWIIGQHHAHLIPRGLPGEGNLLVFDNGGWAGYGSAAPRATPPRRISASRPRRGARRRDDRRQADLRAGAHALGALPCASRRGELASSVAARSEERALLVTGGA